MSAILIIAKGKQEFFPTIREASEVTGISCKRLYRALAHEDGLIFNTAPPLFVDVPSWEITPEEVETYYAEKMTMAAIKRIDALRKHDKYREA